MKNQHINQSYLIIAFCCITTMLTAQKPGSYPSSQPAQQQSPPPSNGNGGGKPTTSSYGNNTNTGNNNSGYSQSSSPQSSGSKPAQSTSSSGYGSASNTMTYPTSNGNYGNSGQSNSGGNSNSNNKPNSNSTSTSGYGSASNTMTYPTSNGSYGNSGQSNSAGNSQSNGGYGNSSSNNKPNSNSTSSGGYGNGNPNGSYGNSSQSNSAGNSQSNGGYGSSSQSNSGGYGNSSGGYGNSSSSGNNNSNPYATSNASTTSGSGYGKNNSEDSKGSGGRQEPTPPNRDAARVFPTTSTGIASLNRETLDIALFYAQFARNAYGSGGIPAGWRRLSAVELGRYGTTTNDSETGFHAEVYTNGQNRYIISYEGTNNYPITDWIANFQQAFTTYEPQFQQAVNLAIRVNNNHLQDDVSITGHSLGGGLASAAAIATGRRAITFNACGFRPETISSSLGHSGEGFSSQDRARFRNITAIHIDGEPLNTLQDGGGVVSFLEEVADHYRIPIGLLRRITMVPAYGNRYMVPRHNTGINPIEWHLMEYVIAALEAQR